MRTTIDGAGRLVIPKSIRDSAGLTGGAELEILFRDGRIEVEIPTSEMVLTRVNGLPVILGPPGIPVMPAAVPDAALQAIRSDRERAGLGKISR